MAYRTHIALLSLWLLWPALAAGHNGAVASPDLVVAYKVNAGKVQLGLNVPARLTGALLGAPLDLSAPLTLEAQQALKQQLLAALRAHNGIEVGGARLTPSLSQITLVHNLPHGRLDDLPVAEGVVLHSSPWTAIQLRVDYPRPATGPITFSWTLEGAWPGPKKDPRGKTIQDPGVPATLYPGPDAQPVPFTFTRATPRFTWRPPETPETPPTSPAPASAPAARPAPPPSGGPWLPLGLGIGALALLGLALGRRRQRALFGLGGAALLVGAGLTGWPLLSGAPLDPAEAERVFRRLHRNIYTAFDQRSPDAIYDVLARSVDGPLLDEIYNEVYDSLILREDDGVRITITEVAQQSVEVLPAPVGDGGFAVKARWRVVGEVAHWGHGHRRVNQYSARYTLAPREGGQWRIVSTELLEQSRETTEISGALLQREQGR